MFESLQRFFKRQRTKMEHNAELSLISNAFSQLESKRKYFDDMHRMYEGRYSDDFLISLQRENYNTIYVPLVRNIINTIVGHFNSAFFSGKNPIEIRPVLSENNDKTQGINRLLQYYYEICNPQDELLKAIRGAMVYGFACVNIYWDKTKQKVITKYLPINQIALDPSAMSLADAGYVCAKISNTLEYYEEIFKDIKGMFPSKKPTDMIELQEIYIRRLDCWDKTSFINNICVENTKVATIPYCYGYALQKLTPPNEHKLSTELMWLGDCLPRLLAAMQNEMNKKRNLKMDLDELKINPKGVYTEGFPTQILQQGAGSVALAPAGSTFTPITFGGDLNIAFDIELINKEAEEASGANSIHMGRTNPSDRRSATSLAIINSSSSVRIEEMIATINNTLFEHWAKRFVTLVKNNAPMKIREELEADFLGEDITTFLKVNFGSSFAIDKRIASLSGILQTISQNPNMNPEIIQRILEEIITLELGDSYDVKEMFRSSDEPILQAQSRGIL